MERRNTEEKPKIFKRKIIQNLYNINNSEGDPSLDKCNNVTVPSHPVADGSENLETKFDPVSHELDTGTDYGQKLNRVEKSVIEAKCSGSELELNSSSGGQDQEKTENKTKDPSNDKLAPYFSDDEDSEENSTKKRKRKRRRYHTPLNSSLGNRSSSSSSGSNKFSSEQSSQSQGTSPMLSRNQRRKPKKRRRRNELRIE